MLKFLSEPAYSLQLDLKWGSVFASQLRTRVFRILFCFVNWIFSGSWSRHRVIFSKRISEPACSSQIDLHWASPQRIWIFVLWNSLIRSLFKFIFYTSDTFRPILALLTYFTSHQLLLMYITTRYIFLILIKLLLGI